MIFAVSCDKTSDDNEGRHSQDNPNAPAELVGSNWTTYNEYEEDLENGTTGHFTESGYINFSTADAGTLGYTLECEEYPEENHSQDINFTYTYQAPSGTIRVTVYGQAQTLTFTVSGNKLTAVSDTEEGSATTVFTRSEK